MRSGQQFPNFKIQRPSKTVAMHPRDAKVVRHLDFDERPIRKRFQRRELWSRNRLAAAGPVERKCARANGQKEPAPDCALVYDRTDVRGARR